MNEKVQKKKLSDVERSKRERALP